MVSRAIPRNRRKIAPMPKKSIIASVCLVTANISHFHHLCYNSLQAMAVKLTDIEEARRVLKHMIIPTPIISDARPSRDIRADAHLKAESLQKSGSFKIRGAYNRISRLTADE